MSFFVEIQLIYNSILVSDAQHSDLTIVCNTKLSS